MWEKARDTSWPPFWFNASSKVGSRDGSGNIPAPFFWLENLKASFFPIFSIACQDRSFSGKPPDWSFPSLSLSPLFFLACFSSSFSQALSLLSKLRVRAGPQESFSSQRLGRGKSTRTWEVSERAPRWPLGSPDLGVHPGHFLTEPVTPEQGASDALKIQQAKIPP